MGEESEGQVPEEPALAPAPLFDPLTGKRLDRPDEPKKSRRPWIIAAVVATVLVAIIAVVNSGDDKETIEGAFLLADASGGVTGSTEDCEGDGGYSDISGGQSIKVTDASGEIIGTGTLENIDSEEKRDTLLERWHATGFMEQDEDEEDFDKFLDSSEGAICFMVFEVAVPRSDFYEIQIGGGDRGNLSYSLNDLEEEDWRVSVTIGDL